MARASPVDTDTEPGDPAPDFALLDARDGTTVRKLSAEERREEIARMLSGTSVTEEARAQALRLLDAA